MRDEIKLLIQLQQIDRALGELRAEKAQFAGDIQEALRNMESQAKELANHTDDIQSLRKAQDKREGDLKEIEEKLARLQGQLNMVKTNREYSALQHEILGHKADASRIEDEILTMFERADSQAAELKALAARAEEARQAAEERRRALEVAINDADARIERITGERAALAEKIPRAYLSQYERLIKRGDGKAMAACRSFVCTACSMTLTANTVNLLMAGNELTFCHSCGRILYLAEDEDLEGVSGAGRINL